MQERTAAPDPVWAQEAKRENGLFCADLRSVSDNPDHNRIIIKETQELRTQSVDSTVCQTICIKKPRKMSCSSCLDFSMTGKPGLWHFFFLFVCMYQSGAHPVSSKSTVKEKTLSVLLYHCTVLNTSYKNLLHTSRLQEARPALSLVVGCLCDYTDR